MLLDYRKNHPKSTQKSEKSSFYQCVRTEKLKRTFSFGHHSRQSSEYRWVKCDSSLPHAFFFQKGATAIAPGKLARYSSSLF